MQPLPQPPAPELSCARCTHPFGQHDRGGPCLWWDPPSGDHCDCPAFSYVPPDAPGQV